MNNGTFHRLWVPTLVVAVATILCFAFLSYYQNTQVRRTNELNIKALELMRDVERVLAAMMQGVAMDQDADLVNAARISNNLEGLILELSAADEDDRADLWPTYQELYRNLVTGVALFRENRIQEASKAMETVRHLENALRMSLERMAERIAVTQARLGRTMNLLMAAAAFLLLAAAMINGLVFVPSLVVRPMNRINAQLRAGERRLSATLRSIGDGVISTDAAGMVTSLNLAAETLTGWAGQEALGRPVTEIFQIINGETEEKVVNPVSRALEKGVTVGLDSHTLLAARDGVRRKIADSCAPIRDDQGLVIGAVLVFRDVTGEHQIQESLKKSHEQYILAVKGSNDGIWDWDMRDSSLFLSPKWKQMIGYADHELANVFSTFSDLMHPEDKPKVMEYVDSYLKGRTGVYNIEFRLRHKDGSYRWILARGEALRDEKGMPYRMAGSHTDISESKKTEEKLLEINSKLEEATLHANAMADQARAASTAKSEFLANMSHEIRTPMNGVIGMTGLLLETKLTDEQRAFAATIQSSGEALLSLINDILDFSKIEAGKLDLESVHFELRVMLDDFASMMAFKAEQKGLEFLYSADPDVPERLFGDPGRLRQVLTNLAGNAVKFTEHGEVVVRVSVMDAPGSRVEVQGYGEIMNDPVSQLTDPDLQVPDPKSGGSVALRFSVSDTGIGIPRNKLGLLFDKFSQVDASTTRQYGGTGLGLAISKQLAEMMGGEVGVASEQGQGSEFWFTVRLGIQAGGAKAQAPVLEDLRQVRVLIVDDNATNREILTTRLSSWGMRPVAVQDGPSALQALYRTLEQGDAFRLAVIDMQMPGMDGEALGRAIQADKRLADTRMVMLTSLGARGDAKRFAEMGFVGYLTKPVRHQELRGVLSLALSGQGEARPRPPAGAADADKRAIVTRHTARENFFRFAGRKARILLAEDNITNQQVALAMLKNLGLAADVVANGAEALKALEIIPYDLVLMDVQMPVMDGLEATRRIRQMMNDECEMMKEASDHPSSIIHHSSFRIPIIAMTAHSMQGDREKCLAAGMDDYLSKPVSPRTLAEVLERWLPGEKARENLSPAQSKVVHEENSKERENGVFPARMTDHAAPVFNRTGMMARLMNDKELARNVATLFLDDVPRQITALQGCLTSGDLPDAERQAHTIRGASANVGGERLRAVAFEMEKAAKDGDLNAVKSRMDELQAEFERLREAMLRDLFSPDPVL